MAVNTGLVTLNGATSGTVSLQSPAVGGGNTLVLPPNNGSSGYQLTTDGTGILSWATAYPDMITVPVREITSGGFDLALGPFWKTTTAFVIPNPTNAVASASGLIYFGATPTGWGTNFEFVGGSPVSPIAGSVAPFWVYTPTRIFVGAPQGAFS